MGLIFFYWIGLKCAVAAHTWLLRETQGVYKQDPDHILKKKKKKPFVHAFLSQNSVLGGLSVICAQIVCSDYWRK